MHNQISLSRSRTAGYFFIGGGAALLVEFCLIALGLVTVELPDRKIDMISIALSTAAWILLLYAYTNLLLGGFLQKKNRVLWIPIMGLTLYTLGCVFIMLSLWDLVLIVPVGLLFTATGTLLVSIYSFRSHLTDSVVSWAFLAAGLYPFLFMFLVVAIYGAPNYMVNYLWGAPWLAVGMLLARK